MSNVTLKYMLIYVYAGAHKCIDTCRNVKLVLDVKCIPSNPTEGYYRCSMQDVDLVVNRIMQIASQKPRVDIIVHYLDKIMKFEGNWLHINFIKFTVLSLLK